MRLIDAHKLEKEFKRIYNVTQNCQSLDWGTIKNTIRDQLEVEPVKHGHWIADRIEDKHWLCYDCSECGNMGTVKSNYCPWCGARMDDEVAE